MLPLSTTHYEIQQRFLYVIVKKLVQLPADTTSLEIRWTSPDTCKSHQRLIDTRPLLRFGSLKRLVFKLDTVNFGPRFQQLLTSAICSILPLSEVEIVNRKFDLKDYLPFPLLFPGLRDKMIGFSLQVRNWK